MILSTSEENHLKAIYSLTKGKENTRASTNNIAEKLNSRASSVTDMIKKLSEKKLIDYEKYQGTKLTEEGFFIAVKIIRKHRLWEVFLLEKLNFKWYEVHDIAEQLEHIQSTELTNRLDKFLNYPKIDPHGDPIPNKDGKLSKIDSIFLSQLVPKDKARIVGVLHSESSFLQYLEKNQLILGVEITLNEKFDFDKSVQVKTSKGIFNLSEKVAKNIRVIKIEG